MTGGKLADDLARALTEAVDRRATTLHQLSTRLHEHPELKFQEENASRWVADFLEGAGFQVERGACGLPTAFIARIGHGRPCVAILCEYDALPGVGHACGHNIIAAAGAGAGAALASCVDSLSGSIVVLGTPAEEGGGGKVVMARAGAFAEVDAAMMLHPAGADLDAMNTLAVTELEVEFLGRASHAAASPEEGINALDAMVIAYTAIAQLRQHIRGTERVHGIITDGGRAPNIVPERAAGTFYVRAATNTALAALRKRVVACFEAGALSTGASVQVRNVGEDYAEMRNNPVMLESWRRHMAALGRTVRHDPTMVTGSTDMGNISQIVPSIHPMIAVSPPHVALHTLEFAQWTNSDAAALAVTDGAKGLALTAAELLASPTLLDAARSEHQNQLRGTV